MNLMIFCLTARNKNNKKSYYNKKIQCRLKLKKNVSIQLPARLRPEDRLRRVEYPNMSSENMVSASIITLGWSEPAAPLIPASSNEIKSSAVNKS